MKRLVQLGLIVVCVYAGFTLMRPFLGQINLELGNRAFMQATTMAVNKEVPKTHVLKLLANADRKYRIAKQIVPGDGQIQMLLARVAMIMVDVDRDMSKQRRTHLLNHMVRIANEGIDFYVDNMITFARAKAYLHLNKFGPAIKDLETSLFFHPTWSQAIANLSRIYQREIQIRYAKDPARLTEAMEALVARFPTYKQGYNYLGRVYMSQVKPRRARWCFQKSGNILRPTPEMGLSIAQTYATEDNYTKALWILSRVIAFAKPGTSKEMSQVLTNMGTLLRRDRQNADAHYSLGVYQQEKVADYNMAKRHYLNAFRSRSNYLAPVLKLIEVCTRLGQADEAARWEKTKAQILRGTTRTPMVTLAGRQTAYCIFTEEAENMSPILGEVVDDPDASGGKALLLKKSVGKCRPIKTKFAPLPAGTYELSFRIKLPDMPEDTGKFLASLDVEGEGVRLRQAQPGAGPYVKARQIRRTGVYWDVVYIMEHPGLSEYDLYVDYMGAADLYIDRIALAFCLR